MTAGMRLPLRTVRNYARLVWAARRGERPIYWPLITSCYLNHRCNLSCSYCDDGSGTKYPDAPATEIDFASWKQILTMMRGVNDLCSFTGGEPTLRRDFPDIVAAARELGFFTHVNTNGTVWKVLREALPFLDAVSVSLDSLDVARSDAVFGAGPGRTQRVIETLHELADLRRGGAKFHVVVNSVIREDNVEEVFDVLDFCWDHGFGFGPLPYVKGFYPGPGLVGNATYHRFMTHLGELKRAGYPIEGTAACVEGMRDWAKFDCVPMTVARVQPDGTLYFPCNMLHTYGANLLSVRTFREAVDEGLARNGYVPPTCDSRCHMSCYMDFALIVQRPSLVLRDGWHRARSILRRTWARASGGSAYPRVPRPAIEPAPRRRSLRVVNE